MFPFIYNNTWITDDKVLHFISAFIISYFIYIFFKMINEGWFVTTLHTSFIYNKNESLFLKNLMNKFSLKRIVIITLFTLLILGIWKEIKDFYTPWRNVEILDIITNYIWMAFFYFLLYIKINIFKLFNK